VRIDLCPMDEHRRLRSLYPSAYLAAALLWAWHRSRLDAPFHQHAWRESLRALQEALGISGWPQAGVALVVGALAFAAAGFVIGTTSFLLLRLSGRLVRLWSKYGWRPEAVMSAKMQRRVLRDHFGRRGALRERGPFLVAAFDQQRIGPGLRAWIERRWKAFHQNAHSATALLFAMAFVPLLELDPGAPWWGTMLAGVALFALAAWCAYADTWRMNDLLADKLPDWAQGEEPPREDEVAPTEDPLPRLRRVD